jgi:hypothetical protein
MMFLRSQEGESHYWRAVGSLQAQSWLPGLKDSLTRQTAKSSQRGISHARPEQSRVDGGAGMGQQRERSAARVGLIDEWR